MTAEDERLELDLVLETIHRKFGYDFRGYARPSVARQIRRIAAQQEVQRISELIPRLLSDTAVFDSVLRNLSITVTGFFRDPGFFLALRRHVVPILRSYPRLRVWVPGCATGEEAYSLTMLLEEEDLYERSRIYATDFNRHALESAAHGVYARPDFEAALERHRRGGGTADALRYVDSRGEHVRIRDHLRRNLVFDRHNLVTDGAFAEMNLIVCRNVLIYFDRCLRDRVVDVFRESLCPGGFLAIGPKESLQPSDAAAVFEPFVSEERIHRLVGPGHAPSIGLDSR